MPDRAALELARKATRPGEDASLAQWARWLMDRPSGFWRTLGSRELDYYASMVGSVGEQIDEHREAEERGHQIVNWDDPEGDDELTALRLTVSFAAIADQLLAVWTEIRLERERRHGQRPRRVSAATAPTDVPRVRARVARPRECRHGRRTRRTSSSSSDDGSGSTGDSDSEPPLGRALTAARRRAGA